jgi:hypothetical protein
MVLGRSSVVLQDSLYFVVNVAGRLLIGWSRISGSRFTPISELFKLDSTLESLALSVDSSSAAPKPAVLPSASLLTPIL